MEKFEYKPLVKKVYWWFFGLLVAVIAIIIRINLEILSQKADLELVITLITLLALPISILLRLVFIVRPRIFSSYQLLDDKIVLTTGQKQKEILFSNIRELRFSWLPQRFLGGFRIILHSGQKFYFLSVLEGSELILRSIMESRSELINEDRYNKYLKESNQLKSAWERMSVRIAQWKWLTIKYIIYPVFVSYLFYDKHFSEKAPVYFLATFVGVFLLNSFVATIMNVIEEFIYGSVQYQKLSLKVSFNLEKSIYYSTQVVFFALTITIYFYLLYS